MYMYICICIYMYIKRYFAVTNEIFLSKYQFDLINKT